MQPKSTSMRIHIKDPACVLDPGTDELLETMKRDDGTRFETYRTPLGREYRLEIDKGEPSRSTFAELGRLGGRKGGEIGGRSTSEKKLAALAQNRRNSDGRTPTTPAGLARLPLRKALETIFGKPLPKTDAPIRHLVSPMSSARVVRRAWDELQERAPEDRRAEISALVENLARTLDAVRAAERVEAARIDQNGRLVDSEGQPLNV